ncbi:hypothetical protein [Thiohalorhabdus sp.]|uniref:hypothetical protein n=1 Tax=Thiohalorhabdus sp. TaxID=3094134 RepID=UPI002FC294A4
MSETVRFPDSLEAFGGADFESALTREVRAQHWHIPIQDFCRAGAWPAFDEELRISVHHTEADDEMLQVTAFVSFDPTVPSYCNDQHHVEPAHGFLRITIDKATAAASFETEPLGR